MQAPEGPNAQAVENKRVMRFGAAPAQVNAPSVPADWPPKWQGHSNTAIDN